MSRIARLALPLVALSLWPARARADALDDLLAQRCTVDARLTSAAAAALDPEADTDALRRTAHEAGLAAPSLRVWRGAVTEAGGALDVWIGHDPRSRVGNRCAVARRGEQAAVVHAPQVVELVRDAGGAVTHATLPPTAQRAQLAVLTPDGQVWVRPLGADGAMPAAMPAAGTFQVVAALPEGPTPLALWTVGDVPQLEVDASVTHGSAVIQRLNGLRRAAGRTPLRADPLLARFAQQRAVALAAWGAPAHATAPDDGPLQRLARAGLTAEMLGENVALARSLPYAHARLLASPSHRATALDARLDAVGVGVAPRGDGVAVVVVFARHPGLRGP